MLHLEAGAPGSFTPAFRQQRVHVPPQRCSLSAWEVVDGLPAACTLLLSVTGT